MLFSRCFSLLKNCRKMSVLLPNKVLGISELDREKFQKSIQVPQVSYNSKEINIHELTPLLKSFYLKMEKLKPMQKETILLNPNLVKDFEDLPVSKLKDIGITRSNFKFGELTLTYENFRCDEVIKAVIPDDLEPVTSYSRIGHIVHLNLRDHLLPYKSLIGQIIMDKVVGCKTVINKAQTIENTYRNFQIELLCGVPKYEVQTKENGCTFEFDFSQVYWNPRLSSEHERIFKMLNKDDIFYDVFAGVGPFSLPAGKKKVRMCLANDLNPVSYKWLTHNVKKNKVADNVRTFMKDGRDFIKCDVRNDLLERIQEATAENNNYKIHIAMNLPAMAVEFLDSFVGLLKDNQSNITSLSSCPQPLVHVYCFIKGLNCDFKELAKQLVEENLLGHKLKDNLEGITFVRNVSPNKEMMRVSFYLNDEILFDNPSKRSLEGSGEEAGNPKKICN